jgi:hypothetical protein
MITINREPRRATATDLRQVVEPLASYICATDQPKAALNLAFSVLVNEVAQIHRAAKAQVAAFATANRV